MEDGEAAAAAMRASKRRRPVRFDDHQVQPGSSSQQEEQQSDLVDLIGRRLDDLISRRLTRLHEDTVGAILSLFPTKDDLISRLPDDVLGAIVSLLPAKDGARTQLLSRWWRPLWRSSMAPLDLVADCNLVNGDIHKRIAVISKILSDHPGPARCFSLDNILVPKSLGEIDGWFRSPSLNNLQELEVTYHRTTLYPMPPSVLRFAPTLRVAEFGSCQFPELIAWPSPNFPHLKQLALCYVTISDDSIHSPLSGCDALESLSLHDIDFGCLCINSPTLKSISFYTPFTPWNQESQELIIEDTPCLERLVPLDPDCGRVTIRVIRAPKLEILGLLSEGISTLHIGTTIFQKMIAVNLTTQMDTVKILVLNSAGPNLSSVVSFLKCFPCLGKLYVSISHPKKDMNNMRKYDKLDRIESLELHLKTVVLKDYDGNKRPTIDFAKFFILNAKVLEEMEIGVLNHRNDKWMRCQSRQLQVENRASRDAKIELKRDAERKFKHHTGIPMIFQWMILLIGPIDACYRCSR